MKVEQKLEDGQVREAERKLSHFTQKDPLHGFQPCRIQNGEDPVIFVQGEKLSFLQGKDGALLQPLEDQMHKAHSLVLLFPLQGKSIAGFAYQGQMGIPDFLFKEVQILLQRLGRDAQYGTEIARLHGIYFQQLMEDDEASLISLKLKIGIAFQLFPELLNMIF